MFGSKTLFLYAVFTPFRIELYENLFIIPRKRANVTMIVYHIGVFFSSGMSSIFSGAIRCKFTNEISIGMGNPSLPKKAWFKMCKARLSLLLKKPAITGIVLQSLKELNRFDFLID